MVSKFDLLREGEAVEIRPGVSGRLNKDAKTLELSTGEILPVENDPDFFPPSEKALAYSREKEKIEKGVAQETGGEFVHQFKTKGLVGGARDWVQYLTKSGEDYQLRKAAEEDVSKRISKESPYTSMAATGASFIPDLALTGGLKAATAAPLLVAGSAGSRALTDFPNVAGEAALASGLGFGLDKAAGWLGKVAQRRGASRALPGEREAVSRANILGKEAADLAGREEQEAFRRTTEGVKRENAARAHQYNLANEEVNRINREYKAAQAAHKEAVGNLPKAQQEAQRRYSQSVIESANQIEKNLPSKMTVDGTQLNSQRFIDENIRTTGLAGSREGNQATRIIRSLFPEEEALTGKELARRYKAIEEAIQISPPEVQRVLSEFKGYLYNRIPVAVEESAAFTKLIPTLKRKIDKDIPTIINKMSFGKGQERAKEELVRIAKQNVENLMAEIGPKDFIQRMKNGDLTAVLSEGILTPDDFLRSVGITQSKALQKSGMGDLARRTINDQYELFSREISKKLDNHIARGEIAALKAGEGAKRNIRAPLKKTLGTAAPLTPPPEPIAPSIEAPIRPTPLEAPTPPSPVPFSPQPEPILSPAQTGAERMGDQLEKPLFRGNTQNNLVKLGALKYVLGKAAAPVEALAAGGYGALKALTAPGAEGLRLSFRRGGIEAINQLASKYQSYHDGILDDPQERRSLTKEIEDDPEIPIEKKAILQSRINRGKPLSLSGVE